MRGRAPQATRERGWGRVLLAHASECKLYLECYCACRRYQDCHCGERRLRYVAAFVGQLSDKPLLASIIHVGCRNALHNGGSRNYVLIRFDDSVVRQYGEFEIKATKAQIAKDCR